MTTAIVTTKPTTLTINASEFLNLEQIGHEDHRIELSPGVNKVPVGVGLFRVLSTASVQVTADTADTQIVAVTKDGNGSPDPPKLNQFINATALKIGMDPMAVRRFINNAASEAAPS